MKKYLLRIIIILVQIVFVFNLISCQEFDINSQKEFPLQMDCDAQPTYTVLALAPSEIVFNISSNTPWKVISSADWCIVDPAMSSASALVGAVTVHIADNPNETHRSATLTVKAEGLSEDVVITINQESKGALHVQPVDNVVPATGGQATFTITSNKDWEVVSEKQWVTFDKAEGKGTGEVTIINATVDANDAGKRTSVITVSSGLEKRTFEIRQDGITLEFAEITEEGLTVFKGHGIQEARQFAVVANIDWNVECKENWVEVVKVDAEHLEVRTIKDNPIFANRDAQINLVPVGVSAGALTITPLTIFQETCFNADIIVPATGEISATGTLTLTTTENRKCRYYTKASDYKLGTYIWKFSKVSFGDPFFFDINFYNEKGGARFELFLGKNFLTNTLGTWGSHDWWSENNFDMTLDEMNAMKTLKIEFLKKENDPSKVVLKAFLNDRILVSIEKDNPYLFPEMDHGNTIYFGFNGTCANAHITIDSFEVIPQE